MATLPKKAKIFIFLGMLLTLTLSMAAFMAVGGVWHDHFIRQFLVEKAYANAFYRLEPLLEDTYVTSHKGAEESLHNFVQEERGMYAVLFTREGEAVAFAFSSLLAPEQKESVRAMVRSRFGHSLIKTGEEHGVNMLSTARAFDPSGNYFLAVGVEDPFPRVSFLDVFPHNLPRSILLTFALATLIAAFAPLRRWAVHVWKSLCGHTHAFDERALVQTFSDGSVSDEGILLLEPNGRIAVCNEKLCRIFALNGDPKGQFFSSVLEKNLKQVLSYRHIHLSYMRLFSLFLVLALQKFFYSKEGFQNAIMLYCCLFLQSRAPICYVF